MTLRNMLDLKDIMKIVRSYLEKFDKIVFAYLYGSVARGEIHAFSDVDVAIYLKKTDLQYYMKILANFPDLGREVDVRLLNDAPPLFRYNVIKDGILILCRDKRIHEEFLFKTFIEALEIKDDIEKIIRNKFEVLVNARR